MYGFVYITTNNLSGKRYIGKKKISSNSKSYLGSGKLVKEDIKNIGYKHFTREILEYCNCAKSLTQREQFFIEFYDAVNSPNYYNIACGHSTLGFSGKKHSIETRQKMRDAYKKPVLTADGKKRMRESALKNKSYIIAAKARKECIGSTHHQSIPVIINDITYESINIAFQSLKNTFSVYQIRKLAGLEKRPDKKRLPVEEIKTLYESRPEIPCDYISKNGKLVNYKSSFCIIYANAFNTSSNAIKFILNNIKD